jgi:hypothetical protein
MRNTAGCGPCSTRDAQGSIGYKLRGTMNDAMTMKGSELQDSSKHWPDRAMVIKDLDAGVAYLGPLQDTITCFLNSIERQENTCDVNELKKKLDDVKPQK